MRSSVFFSSVSSMAIPTLLFATIFFSVLTSRAASQQPFNCSSAATCRALIDYFPSNTTTIAAIQSLFDVKNLRTLLGASNLPLSTPSTLLISPKQSVKIPFPCKCSNKTGTSNRFPTYEVQKGDGLYDIASRVYSGLTTYQEIARVNNIGDVNLIKTGQELWIPLPCSCDQVEGEEVVHYGYVVEAGGSVDGIAQRFGTTQETLLRLNGLGDPTRLKAGAVFDVPLKACKSRISNNSLDSDLLLANSTYVFTANNCIMCSCDSANNWSLHCIPSQLKPANSSGWSACPLVQCEGTSLYIGNSTSSGCNQTTCGYAGYNNQTILPTLVTESICPGSDNHATRIGMEGLSRNFILICVHLALLSLKYFQ